MKVKTHTDSDFVSLIPEGSMDTFNLGRLYQLKPTIFGITTRGGDSKRKFDEISFSTSALIKFLLKDGD